MEKNIMSYYDWELGFKEKSKEKIKINKDEEITEIGIPKSKFKDFIVKWKKQNLA